MTETQDNTDVRCGECGKAVSRSLAEDSNEWRFTEDNEWNCPHCNPETDTSW